MSLVAASPGVAEHVCGLESRDVIAIAAYALREVHDLDAAGCPFADAVRADLEAAWRERGSQGEPPGVRRGR